MKRCPLCSGAELQLAWPWGGEREREELTERGGTCSQGEIVADLCAGREKNHNILPPPSM